jgi:hypothetical protein
VLTDGTAPVYFTTNGTTPTISGGACYKIPQAGAPSALQVDSQDPFTEVQLISAGTPTYSVTIARR